MDSVAYKRSTQVLSADVGADAVALNIDSGHCFGMEKVTAAIWTLLDRPITVDDIVDQLVAIYDVSAEQCRSEVSGMLAAMEAASLVERSAEAPAN